ncbi:hypothetical protein N7G274_000982 [Stereocaulon virgatum]|uniref:Phosphatidylglycerol/phosphatidylinositol transfer protein n=1 Tax=Stereocaulon virgatum TaxID=373712 RepID=A0ABR4AMJ4_9LECA
MKFTQTLLSFLISCVAVSNTLSLFGGDQHVLDDEKLTVPGDNPLKYCRDEDHLLDIYKVDLDPNPPLAGKTLTIKAHGNFTEDVEEGAYIILEVHYGLIRLISQTTDLCEQMKNVDEECPLSGEKTITKEVELPKAIPPGDYKVKADVFTKEKKAVVCLEAAVHFGSGKL